MSWCDRNFCPECGTGACELQLRIEKLERENAELRKRAIDGRAYKRIMYLVRYYGDCHIGESLHEWGSADWQRWRDTIARHLAKVREELKNHLVKKSQDTPL